VPPAGRFLGIWTGRFAEALIDFAALPAHGPVGASRLSLKRRYPGRRSGFERFGQTLQRVRMTWQQVRFVLARIAYSGDNRRCRCRSEPAART
jgi:hypothetical protein